jgi:hypothetical protein
LVLYILILENDKDMSENNTSATDKLVGGFFIGCAFMFCLGLILSLIVLAIPSPQPEIRTKKKITPEWELTTDGKKIDTIYIYKQK